MAFQVNAKSAPDREVYLADTADADHMFLDSSLFLNLSPYTSINRMPRLSLGLRLNVRCGVCLR